MSIFVIMCKPKYCDSFMHSQAFTSLEAAQEAIRSEDENAMAKTPYKFKNAVNGDYYYIDKLEVKK